MSHNDSTTLKAVSLTGDCTAVTQTQSDNSTKLATTAYVDTAVSGVGGSKPDVPSGYWWFIKGSPQCYLTYSSSSVRYAWRDTTTNTKYGRSGFIITQESAQNQGGDELACALIDCTSSSVTVALNVESLYYASNFNSSTSPGYSGKTRAIIWRLG